MLKKLFRLWINKNRLWHDSRAIEEKIANVTRANQEGQRRVATILKEVERREARYVKQIDILRDEVNRQTKINSKLEEALDSAREELRTCQEITIPGLVSSNEVLIKRFEASTQVEVARAALLRAGRDPGES